MAALLLYVTQFYASVSSLRLINYSLGYPFLADLQGLWTTRSCREVSASSFETLVVVVACLGCKVAADLVITVMMGFAAAFDYCNLDSLFGCSYHERGEVLPLNEYCPLDPFDETFQDEVASYHRLKRFVAVVEDQYYTFHRACQDAPFVVNP